MPSNRSLLAAVHSAAPRLAWPIWATRTWVAADPERGALARILGCLILTRLLLFVVAACAIRILPADLEPKTEIYLGKNLSLAAWVRWDTWWYLSVVERGYWFDAHGKSNVAFFPVFPVLIKGLTAVVGNPVVVGLVIANVAAVGAIIVFWRWVRVQAGLEAAERAVLWLLVYPFSFFFHTIYAESLFFLLGTLALAAAGRGRWLSAGLWGCVAAATRPMGVLLAPAFAWGIWRAWRAGQSLGYQAVLGVLLPPAGLGAYIVYLWAAFGDPLAFWTAHAAGWKVQFQWNLAGYWRETYWILTRMPRLQAYTQLLDGLRVVLPLVFIGLTIRAYRRLGAVPGLYACLAVAVGIFFAPESVGREFLAVVPAFAAAGLSSAPGATGEGLRMCSLGLLIIFLFAFVTGHFVG